MLLGLNMKNDNITVVFTTDENYVKPLSAAIISLLENNKDLYVVIYLIHSGLKKNIVNKITKMISKYDARIIYSVVNTKNLPNLFTSHHITMAAYYRLLIPHFVKDDIVLYLDCDLIVNGSIRDLFNIDVSDYYLGAVEDVGIQKSHIKNLGMKKFSKYFNSGVLLINLRKWKLENLSERVMLFITSNEQIIRYHDQDGLNAIIDGDWVRVPSKFNLQTNLVSYFENDVNKVYPLDELNEAKKTPKIIHFTTGDKPWHFLNNHPHKKLFKHYLRMTNFNSLLPELIIQNSIKKFKVTIKKLIKVPL